MDDVLNAEAPDAPRIEAVERPRRLEIWLPLVIVVLDQLTKAAVRATLPLHQSVTIIPGLVDFTHVRNTGAAFGILNLAEFPFKSARDCARRHRGARRRGHVRREPGASSARGAHRTGADHRRRHRQPDRSHRRRLGRRFRRRLLAAHHFWAFNVADSAITVGVAIMILDMLGIDGRRAEQ